MLLVLLVYDDFIMHVKSHCFKIILLLNGFGIILANDLYLLSLGCFISKKAALRRHRQSFHGVGYIIHALVLYAY